jgi:hypothetical protein
MIDVYAVYVWHKLSNVVTRKEYFTNEDCAWAFHDAMRAAGHKVEFKIEDAMRMAG